MSVTLDELLSLVGRLDDAPGFDSPRERFRRFLVKSVADVATARSLIEECQRSVGEQRHRALQDLVTALGRLLGFDVTFGTYERSADGVGVDAHWRSPGLLDVVLEIRTEQTMSPTLEGMARAIAVAPAPAGLEPRIGLCVVARQYAGLGKIERALAAVPPHVDVRVVSVRSLLSLAAQASAGRLVHAEIVRLLQSGGALDLVVDLLDRPAANGQTGESIAETGLTAPPRHDEPRYWVAIFSGDEVGAPDHMLTSVIAQRRILAISGAPGSTSDQASPGDWVCFFVPRTGIVGHAQLGATIEDSAKVVRHARRFSRVYRLSDVALYDRPVVQALRADRPFAVPPADPPLAGPFLSPIARRDFLALMAHGQGAPDFAGPNSATA
jgi:hypothetical protein